MTRPPANVQPTPQALQDAIARWREERELPEDRQLAILVGLVACDPSVLRALGLAPEQAWSALDDRARSIIAAGGRRQGAPRGAPAQGRVVVPLAGKRVPRRLPTAGQLRQMRRQRGERQSIFWSRFGVTQSAGSRYESDRELNAPLGLLIELWASGALSAEDLEQLARFELGDVADLPAARRELVRLALDDPKALRQRIAPESSQTAFWHRLGLSQSGGWRFENSRRHNGSLRRLLVGVAAGRIDESMLAAVSRESSPG